MYYRANSFQRFCAYWVDMLIISFLVSLISTAIFKLINYDENIVSECYSNLISELQGDQNDEVIYQLSIEIIKRYMFELLINLPIFIVLDILYLVILPHFWKKQTLGRCIMGCKVVSKSGDLTLGRLLLRELVGTFIFYQLFSYLGVLVTAILVFTQDRSIVDLISKTALVNSRTIVVSDMNNNNDNNDSNNNINSNYNPDDVIDAKVEDVDDNSSDDSDDDYRII